MSSDEIKIFTGDSFNVWLLDSFKEGDFEAAGHHFGRYFDKQATQDFMSAFRSLSKKLNFSKEREEMILKALLHAHYLHMEQWRKFEDKPYISHILRVSTYFINLLSKHAEAMKSLETSEVKNALFACLLHDSVEDQAERLHGSAEREKALAVVEEQYGEQVRHYLHCLSKPVMDEDDEKTEKYKEWIQGIWESGDILLMMIKFSDIYDNLRSSIDTFASHDPLSMFAEHDGEHKKIIDKAEKWILKYKDALAALRNIKDQEYDESGVSAVVFNSLKEIAKDILKEVEDKLMLTS